MGKKVRSGLQEDRPAGALFKKDSKNERGIIIPPKRSVIEVQI